MQSGVDAQRIGDFEWFIFLANVASFFWSMGLKNAFMSFFPKQDVDQQKALIFNLAVVLFVLGLLGFGVLALLDLPGMREKYTSLPWLFCFLVLGTVASLAEHLLIVKKRSVTIFAYGFISYASYLFGLSFLIIYLDSIQALFIGLGLWAVLRFLYFVYLCSKFGSYVFDLKLIQKFGLFGLPLIVHVLLGGGMEYVDGFLVETYFDRTNFAYFRYGARELPINTIFISAMASAFIPLAVSNFNHSMVEIKKRTSRLMNYLFPISMILMVCSPYLYALVYAEEYVISAHIFNIYLLIIASRILLPQLVIYAKHRNSVLMLVSIFEFGINIILSLYLMRFYGLYGIAFATVVAYLVQKIILIIYNWTTLGVSVFEYLDVKKYAIYTAALYVIFFLCVIFYN